MEIKKYLENLELSNVFLGWSKGHKNSYLAHVFRMFDEANENIWQFGYYNKDDTITTFILEGDDVKEVPEQEIFKKDKKKLLKLDWSKIKIDFLEALEIAEKIQQEKYSNHPIMKKIAILQTLAEGQVYNVTFVTHTFNTINIKIMCDTGKIIYEKLTNLMEIAKMDGKKENTNTSYIG